MISSQYISRITLQRDKVSSFERYPFSLPAVRTMDELELHPKVTFFVGENGSGKSTLLEAIAVAMAKGPQQAIPLGAGLVEKLSTVPQRLQARRGGVGERVETMSRPGTLHG